MKDWERCYDGYSWDLAAIRKLTRDDHDALVQSSRNGRKLRKGLRSKVRYEVLRANPYCSLCGRTAHDGVRLEIDHMDGNPMNNNRSNLQILCQECNIGKGETPWNVV